MSEQQMPARIWVNPIAIVRPDIYFPNSVMVDGNENIKTGDVKFIRADIAERMADILTEARLQIEYLQVKFQHTGSGNAVLARIEEALSAFRSATQDTDARHD